jgi:hypothetical protein
MRSKSHALTAALVATAIAAPTALARPADMPPAVAKAAATTQHRQIVRSVDSHGFPTRPVLDRSPAAAPSSPLDDVTVPPTDSGLDWATIGIGIAGSLLAVAGIGAIASRTRRTGRPRIRA